MHRVLATIISAVLLVFSQSSLGTLVSGPKQGLVFQHHGNCYGVYDQYVGIDEVTSDGTIVARLHWSGIALGPLGQFGVTTKRPWVREAAPLVLVLVGVVGAAIVLRRFRIRVRAAM